MEKKKKALSGIPMLTEFEKSFNTSCWPKGGMWNNGSGNVLFCKRTKRTFLQQSCFHIKGFEKALKLVIASMFKIAVLQYSTAEGKLTGSSAFISFCSGCNILSFFICCTKCSVKHFLKVSVFQKMKITICN